MSSKNVIHFDSPVGKMADISTLNVVCRTLRTTYMAEAKTNFFPFKKKL
jgi:hypothetical protein